MLALSFSSLAHKIVRRRPDSHKGDFGHILVLGGSPGLTGAACLCAKGALRSGAGMVTIGIPAGLNSIIEVKVTEAMSLPLPQGKDGCLSLTAFSAIKEFSQRCDAMVIGPGLSQATAVQKLVLKLVETLSLPMVVDADGLNALAKNPKILRKGRLASRVLTPHPGEMRRLTGRQASGVEERKSLAKDFALKYNVITVLKGYQTVVASKEGECYVNTSGNPGMATAGSGDVLAGIIAAFLAQGLKGYEAACLGVYIHGLAGDLASKEVGPVGILASDIILRIPQVLYKTASL